MSEYYKFFQNKKCEYFPCHKGIPEEDFNCLFCYCPLYTRSNYDKIISRFQEIIAVMAASDKGDMPHEM